MNGLSEFAYRPYHAEVAFQKIWVKLAVVAKLPILSAIPLLAKSGFVWLASSVGKFLARHFKWS